MTATKVGILFSVSQRRRRAVILPDSDDQLPLTPRPGEGYVEQSLADFHTLGPDHAVEQAAGGPPLPDRCAVVASNGEVVGALAGDPAIDGVPGHSLVPHAQARRGDRYDGSRFLRGYAEVDADSGVVIGVGEFDLDVGPPAAGEGRFVLKDYPRTRRVNEVIPEIRDAPRTDPGPGR